MGLLIKNTLSPNKTTTILAELINNKITDLNFQRQ